MDRQNVQTHQLLFYLEPEYKFRVGQIEERGRDGREGGRERGREGQRRGRNEHDVMHWGEKSAENI